MSMCRLMAHSAKHGCDQCSLRSFGRLMASMRLSSACHMRRCHGTATSTGDAYCLTTGFGLFQTSTVTLTGHNQPDKL